MGFASVGMYMVPKRDDPHKFSEDWHGVAVLYARKKDEAVEIVAVYEEHIPQEFRKELETRFEVAVAPWKINAEEK